MTGATGFIGSRVAHILRERGDVVVALVRDPARARDLEALGCELVQGDLDDAAALRRGMEGSDVVFHIAAIYKVGIPKSERAAMDRANVEGTEHVIDAAVEAHVPRIVYVSTVGAFGNTHGKVVDESYEHPGLDYTSHYERTKTAAHRVAKAKIAAGAPVIIVQPGGVYGPHDHSELGTIILDAARGKLPAKSFPGMGMMLAHVDDVAAGIVAAADRGTLGESYILSGDQTTIGEVVDKASEIAGRKPPRMTTPVWLLKALRPAGPLVGKAMGLPPNLGELITSADGVTFWASHDKATRELGYQPRDVDTGLRETLVAEGVVAPS
jgi:nucleoside-diphosphate-sugar epimerase